MRNSALLVATLVCAVFAQTAAAQTCTSPLWYQGPGPIGGYYEYVANGQPTSTSCWLLSGNVQLVSTPGCTYQNAKAFDMHYGSRVIQEFTVPNDRTETHWDLGYLLTKQDPNNDGWWNRLRVSLYDVTAKRTLVSHTYWGDDPDLYCAPRSLSYAGNLANHKLQVIFSDGSAYSNTIFRVRSISLIQY